MNYDLSRFWLEVLIAIGTAGNILYTWVANRNRANKAEINTLRKDHGGQILNLDHRALTLEAKVEALPGARDFHNALQQMTKMDGEIGILNERLAGFKESMERVERPLNLLVEAQMKGQKS